MTSQIPDKDVFDIIESIADQGIRLRMFPKDQTEKGVVDIRTIVQLVQNERKLAQTELEKFKTSRAGIDLSGVFVYEALQKEMDEMQETIETLEFIKTSAYRQRNEVVAALAKMALMAGVNAGKKIDENNKEFPHVLYIDLPTGQTSWHFKSVEYDLIKNFPDYEGSWDNHDRFEKSQRVTDFATKYLPTE